MCTKGAVKFYWEILPRSDVLKKRKKVGLAVDREREVICMTKVDSLSQLKEYQTILGSSYFK